MKRTVTIGEKNIELEAVATISLIMKRLFKVNTFSEFEKLGEAKSGMIDESMDLIMELAFVMAKQAECKDIKTMLSLTEEDYFEWLMQFDALDFVDPAKDIINVYLGSKSSEATAKNLESLQ